MPERAPCTCKVTKRSVKWDDQCPYHGKDGTMIAVIRETRELLESAEIVDREVPYEMDRIEERLRLAESIIHQAERVAKNGGDPTNILRSYAYFERSKKLHRPLDKA